MSFRQQVTTALLAVLIVASVMSVPRTTDVPREAPRAAHIKGMVTATASPNATAATNAKELSHEQVKDLTYN